ncbi:MULTISPECIES: type II toxin-antitoxin system Phd/YefM family antitoxin [Telluria group]|uniref:Antitoxin n=1 Tax=Pseudoduganella violacea TaxID=1715466 RepID=A0A7W5FV68_9BURK|nr:MULTISPECIES: type II toxin-antitoxin system Phd/YefM family antitoxin [Telluria group]MBB3119918.1 prevent-host-death family protein [Pseudoduganella violacea]
MTILSASAARASLYRLIDEAAQSHMPITITGKRNSAVLLSVQDWMAIQETLRQLSAAAGKTPPAAEDLPAAGQASG